MLNPDIQNLLIKIAKSQNEAGGFDSWSSTKDDYSDSKKYLTTFTTSHILWCLSFMREYQIVEEVGQKAYKFLESQVSDDLTWNYWPRNSKETKYPEDLDDTACALIALNAWNSKYFSPKKVAQLGKLLISQEVKVGGPYKTWLVYKEMPEIWQDTDMVVNANLAYLLNELDTKLPNLITYFNKNKPESSYYPGRNIAKFFLLRATLDSKYLIAKPKNQLEYAMFIIQNRLLGNEMSNYKLDLKTNIDPQPFCIDPAQNGQKYYCGSSSLTMSFMALAEHLSAHNTSDELLNYVPNEIKNSVNQVLKRFKNSTSGQEIIESPKLFWRALGEPSLPILMLEDLSLASLAGWLAYTLYDDIIDGDIGVEAIPAANVCMRISYEILRKYLSENIVNGSFNQIDSANAWEMANCKIKVWRAGFKLPKTIKFIDLAERSQGHILPIQALMSVVKTDNKDQKKVMEFYKNYLRSRQIIDDAHDWEADLKSGRINYVANMLSAQCPEIRQIEKLREYFWKHLLNKIIKEVESFIKKMKKSLEEIESINNKKILEDLIYSQQSVVDKTRSAKRDFHDFAEYIFEKDS